MLGRQASQGLRKSSCCPSQSELYSLSCVFLVSVACCLYCVLQKSLQNLPLEEAKITEEGVFLEKLETDPAKHRPLLFSD